MKGRTGRWIWLQQVSGQATEGFLGKAEGQRGRNAVPSWSQAGKRQREEGHGVQKTFL